MIKLKFTLTNEALVKEGFAQEQIARIRYGMEQNVANHCLEGWDPTEKEIELLELLAFGKISKEEYTKRSLAMLGIKK